MTPGRLVVTCCALLTVLFLLSLLHLALGAQELAFVTPKPGQFYDARKPLAIQLRRETLDPTDRALNVGVFVNNEPADTFHIPIDEYSGRLLPLEPRYIVLHERGEYAIVAVLLQVKDGNIVRRAAADVVVQVP